MKRRKAGRGKVWWWGPLMLGAFLAGLLATGIVILMPGGESSTGTTFSPAQGEPAPPNEEIAQTGPAAAREAQSAHERGFGVLIHVPMEPDGNVSDRTDGFRLRRDMSGEEMGALLGRMIEENPWAKGVSNHMGSAFTADPESMATFVSLLKSRKLFLLDSMTSSRSIAVKAALKEGIPAARRDVFLDAEMQPEELRLQWKKTMAIAKERGAAVLVCHGRRGDVRRIPDRLPR